MVWGRPKAKKQRSVLRPTKTIKGRKIVEAFEVDNSMI